MKEYIELIKKSKKTHIPDQRHPNTIIVCRGIHKALNDADILKAGEIIYSKPIGKQMIRLFLSMYNKGC
jgi:hypothetical protein